MGTLFRIEKVCPNLEIWQNPEFKIVLACFDTGLTLFFVFLRRFIMAHQCPKCGSRNIGMRNYGRKAGAGVGAVAGGASGYFGAASGAAAGAEIGAKAAFAFAGPAGAAVGGFAGAVIGALVGASSGMAIGAATGAAVDEYLRDKYECLKCGHTFSD